MKKTLGVLALACVAGMSQAIVYGFAAPLINGAQQVPATNSQAYGSGSYNLDSTSMMVTGSVAITGLSSTQVTAMHIHLAPVGVNGPVIFDIMGNSAGVVNLSNGFVMAFSAMLTSDSNFTAAQKLNAMVMGDTYINVHTASFPGGEIRGQVDCAMVPEPASLAAIGFGVIALVSRRRRAA
ncbi:MAG: CHRD domain-containing protein [Armatimonadetes bacterium]|nr:CHRD domain-containing protein [Armatimonadota bacterium]